MIIGAVNLRIAPSPHYNIPSMTSTFLHPTTSKSIETHTNNQWDLVLSNTLIKTGLGFGGGVLASILFFKRRAFPVWVGVGFGLGRGYSEGDAIFRSGHGVRSYKA